eukprot:jgi/Mesvir1/3581/Mv12044-RA.1
MAVVIVAGIRIPKWLFIGFCVGGLYASYLTQGLVQEKLSTRRYEPDNERFQQLMVLNLAQNVFCFAWAFGCLVVSGNLRGGKDVAGLWHFWKVAITNTLGPGAGVEALKMISYPSQVLAKSSKMVAVMVVGTLVHRVFYSVAEYLCALLIAGGISLFALSQPAKAMAGKLANPNAPLGYFLCFANLAMDGYTNSTQDEIIRKHPGTNSYHLMAGINLWCTLYSCVWMFAITRHGLDAVAFIAAHPQAAWDILTFCVCGIVGQNFIFLTLSHAGSLVLTTATTTRKFLSILLSSFWNNHQLNARQWGCVGMVFAGLTYSMFLKGGHKAKKVKLEHLSDADDLKADLGVQKKQK